MKIIGIIAEYNPFHTGHMYQISETRKKLDGETAVVCVMSGNWTQQANCSIADKWTRAKLALMGGADLILELPTAWATASAERFALGGVSLLSATGVVDYLSFGSECGDIALLKEAARCLDSPDYPEVLRRFLPLGIPFAVCRQKAVEHLAGAEIASLLQHPNNNLGIEYLRSLNFLNSSISPLTVLRTGAGHGDHPSFSSFSSHQFHAANPVLSATSIRLHLADNHWDLMEPYLPDGGRILLANNLGGLASITNTERAVLARLRSMTAVDWAALPDSAASEGLPQRLVQASKTSASLEEFFANAATKRYTNARLQRLVLWAFLGLTSSDFRQKTPPYLRVLGFNETGRSVLKKMKQTSSLPLITKTTQIHGHNENCRTLFAAECRFTDLYDLCLPSIPSPGREWTTSPVLI